MSRIRLEPGEAHEVTPAGLNSLASEIHFTAVGKGWWPEIQEEAGKPSPEVSRNFLEVLALIHSEVSEALEAYRDGMPISKMLYRHPDGSVCWAKPACDDAKPEGVPSEMADVIIRVLDACAAYGIDIERAVAEKMAYNRTRPSRHGGKLA